MLWAMLCWETLTFGTYHLPKRCYRPGTPLHDNDYPWYKWLHFSRIMHPAHIVQEWFEEQDAEFRVIPWPPNSPNSI